jgi:hypothetical protein
MFPNDRRGLKILVWTMFFWETLFTVFMTIAAWAMFGSGWGDPQAILQFNWTWGLLPLISGIHSGMAQGFYIWRIWHLTKKLWLPVPIALGVFTQLFGLYWFAINFNIAHWRITSLPPLSNVVTVSQDSIAIARAQIVSIGLARRECSVRCDYHAGFDWNSLAT